MAETAHTKLDSVVIRFCGDSGDGMQLVGSELANTSAFFGNDIGTLPDYPAEIRAPRGSLAGVSGFQINIGSYDIHTPGDSVDCLVALNPAALKTNLHTLKSNGVLIVDTYNFNDRGLKLAAYDSNPLEDGSLTDYQTFPVNLTEQNRAVLKDIEEMSHKDKDRSKNFYALGLISWLFNRPLDYTLDMIRSKFKSKPIIADANVTALKGGYSYGDMTELFVTQYDVDRAILPKGHYRSISGNLGLVYGMTAVAQRSGLKLVYAGYPITPASDLMHELFKLTNFNLTVFQAEDEIAAICAAIGASYAGALGVTGSSGPGISLKIESMNLAVMTELPLVIIDVQRAGPSTGMPTKTEQSDLLLAVHGRSGESPVPVIAAARPADAFDTMIEAARVALKYRTPVILLSDAFIGNSSEPWKIPEIDELPTLNPDFATDAATFQPYHRNMKTLAREWAVPGMDGFEHRIGGLEKEDVSGHVSYDADNHEAMIQLRYDKIMGIRDDMAPLEVDGDPSGDILLIGWGSTHGAIRTAVENIRKERPTAAVTWIHLQWVFPFHRDLEEYLSAFTHIIVPEVNSGQLKQLLQSAFGHRVDGFNQIRGLPIQVSDLTDYMKHVLDSI